MHDVEFFLSLFYNLFALFICYAFGLEYLLCFFWYSIRCLFQRAFN